MGNRISRGASRGGATEGASQDARRGVRSANDRSWPWKQEPRAPAPTLAGDVEGAIAFGLAADEAGLSLLTSMLCSGLPAEIECKARWLREGTNTCAVFVEQDEFKYHQSFRRTEDGSLRVDQGYFWLREDLRRQGSAKRLVRNLVHVYDQLGIRHVEVFAGLEDGGITWAILGARPKDPDSERELLLERASQLARELRLDEDLHEAIAEIISEASDEELMQRAVRIRLEDGTRFGELLLDRREWAGFWDLGDEAQRTYLQRTLG